MGQMFTAPFFALNHPGVGCCCASDLPQVYPCPSGSGFVLEHFLGRWEVAMRIPNLSEDGVSISAALASEPATDCDFEFGVTERCHNSFSFVRRVYTVDADNRQTLASEELGMALCAKTNDRAFHVTVTGWHGAVSEYRILDHGHFDGAVPIPKGGSPLDYGFVVLGGHTRAYGWILVRDTTVLGSAPYRSFLRGVVQSLGLMVSDFRGTPRMRAAIGCAYCGLLPGTKCFENTHVQPAECGEWANEDKPGLDVQ